MTYSNDEEIVIEEKSKLKSIFLISGIVLFISSLFNISFCTANHCRTSIEAFVFGGLAMLTGGAAISWLANPFLFISWVMLTKNKKSAWLFSLTSILFSLSFLRFNTVIENEAGQYKEIIKIGIGYWIWIASCVITFIGTITIGTKNYRK